MSEATCSVLISIVRGFNAKRCGKPVDRNGMCRLHATWDEKMKARTPKASLNLMK